MCDGASHLMRQAWQAHIETRLKEVTGPGLAQIDLDLDANIGWDSHLQVFGRKAKGCDVASGPRPGKQLLGGRVRLGIGEYMGRLGAAGR
jgi:hypothetical protein